MTRFTETSTHLSEIGNLTISLTVWSAGTGRVESKADIAARGVQVPVEYDEDGKILDGHHRVRACLELGIKDWPRVIRVGLSEEEKIEHILALNLARRHLTREQRRELVLKLRQQGWSLRRIAQALGVSRDTVHKDVLATVRNLTVENLPDRVIGKDGKSRPAQMPRRKPAVFLPDSRRHEKRIRWKSPNTRSGGLPP